MGIAVAIDVGVLASSRGYRYYRVEEFNPNGIDGKLLIDPLFKSLNYRDLVVIEFLREKESDTTKLFDTKMMVHLDKLRKQEAKEKNTDK